eukprot:11375462-Prorocentrum_lima.AAC.1
MRDIALAPWLGALFKHWLFSSPLVGACGGNGQATQWPWPGQQVNKDALLFPGLSLGHGRAG